jgi:nucleotide-binding universal stress UspA family protein
MFKNVLVCTDGSESSVHAAKAAAEIASRFDSEVTLLNVMNPAPLVTPNMMGVEAAPDAALIYRYTEEAQRAALEKTAHVFDSAGITVTARAEMGQPVDMIIKIAEQSSADLIVMGSRGMGGFSRLLLGSVSDGVLHHAHCPVLIVR